MPFSVPAAALISALAADARALGTLSGCQVVLQPEDADPVWQEAVHALRARLQEPAAGDVDCGGIQVRADGHRTSIVFTTRDGRRAERQVQTPAHLLAIAEALRITIPEAQEQQSEPPSAQPANPVRDEPARPASRGPAPIEAATAHVLIGGSGGVRFLPATPCMQSSPTQNCTFGFPSFRIGVGVNVARWEFGGFGQVDPTEAALSGSAPGLTMSTYAIGLRAGRREPIGPLAAVAGATASIALTDQSNQADQNAMSMGNLQQGRRTLTEPRVGLFAGVVVPRHARVRVRPELTVDARLGPAIGAAEPSLPDLPWWSASASVGIEWEAP